MIIIIVFPLLLPTSIYSSHEYNASPTFYGIPTLQDHKTQCFFDYSVKEIDCFTAIDIGEHIIQKDLLTITKKLSPDSLFFYLPCNDNKTHVFIACFKKSLCRFLAFTDAKQQLYILSLPENDIENILVTEVNRNKNTPYYNINFQQEILNLDDQKKINAHSFMLAVYGILKNNTDIIQKIFETGLEHITTESFIFSSLSFLHKNNKNKIDDFDKNDYKISVEPTDHHVGFSIPNKNVKLSPLKMEKMFLLYRGLFFNNERLYFSQFSNPPCEHGGVYSLNLLTCYWIITTFILNHSIAHPPEKTGLTMVSYGAYSAEFETRLYHDLLKKGTLPINEVYYIETQKALEECRYQTFMSFIRDTQSQLYQKPITTENNPSPETIETKTINHETPKTTLVEKTFLVKKLLTSLSKSQKITLLVLLASIIFFITSRYIKKLRQ